MNMFRCRAVFFCIAVLSVLPFSGSRYAHAEDKLLTNAVNFAGTITYLSTKVPGFMLLGVRNNEMAIAGFGKIADLFDAAVPFLVERSQVEFLPGFHRGYAAHNLFLADFHGAADRAFPRAALRPGGFDQVLAP